MTSGAPRRFAIVVPVAPGRRPLAFDSLGHLGGGFEIEIALEEGSNPSRGRNRAIARTRAEILAFTDDDCVVAPDWLATASAFFGAHPEVDAVGGPQLNLPGERALPRAMGHALGSRFGAFESAVRYRPGPFTLRASQRHLSSANLFLTRNAFERWGPFDERLWPNEETALLRRIEVDGGRIAYDPAIRVFHKRRDDLRHLARQCFGYGRGRARQSQIEGTRLGLPQLVPIGFVLYLALLPIALLWSVSAIVPLLAYGALTLGASMRLALRHRDAAALAFLPAVLVVIHVAYAVGMIVGSLRQVRAPADVDVSAMPLRSAR